MTFIQRRLDVEATLYKCHVPAGVLRVKQELLTFPDYLNSPSVVKVSIEALFQFLYVVSRLLYSCTVMSLFIVHCSLSLLPASCELDLQTLVSPYLFLVAVVLAIAHQTCKNGSGNDEFRLSSFWNIHL